MTFQQFTAFGAVARCKSITQAAHELHTSQPSVSKHIKTLEDSYNLQLFKRNGKGVELTDEGIELLELVDPILKQLQTIQGRFLKRPTQVHSNLQLRLGVSYTASCIVLPPLVKAFNSRYPRVELVLRTSDSNNLAQLLLRGQCDLELSSVVPQIPELVAEPCMPLRLIAFAAKGYSIPLQKNTTNIIDNVPLIIREAATQNGPTKKLLRCFRKQGYRPNVIMRCDSPDAIKMAVSKKLGVGILYEDVLKEDIVRGLFKRVCLQGLPIEQSLYVMHHKNRCLPESADAFLLLLRQWCNGRQNYRKNNSA